MAEPTVTLKTNDGLELTVDLEIARRLGAVQRAMPKVIAPNQSLGIISLCDIDSAMLRLVFQWMVHHRDDWFELTSGPVTELTWVERTEYVVQDEWERRFFGELHIDDLLKLASATRYLEVEVMMQTVCRFISIKIRGKPVSQLRELFGLQLDDDENDDDSQQE